MLACVDQIRNHYNQGSGTDSAGHCINTTEKQGPLKIFETYRLQ